MFLSDEAVHDRNVRLHLISVYRQLANLYFDFYWLCLLSISSLQYNLYYTLVIESCYSFGLLAGYDTIYIACKCFYTSQFVTGVVFKLYYTIHESQSFMLCSISFIFTSKPIYTCHSSPFYSFIFTYLVKSTSTVLCQIPVHLSILSLQNWDNVLATRT